MAHIRHESMLLQLESHHGPTVVILVPHQPSDNLHDHSNV